jgi:hypothetical protein
LHKDDEDDNFLEAPGRRRRVRRVLNTRADRRLLDVMKEAQGK